MALTSFQLSWYRFLRTKYTFSKRQKPMPAWQALSYCRSFTPQGQITVEEWKKRFPALYTKVDDATAREKASERRYIQDVSSVKPWIYLSYPRIALFGVTS